MYMLVGIGGRLIHRRTETLPIPIDRDIWICRMALTTPGESAWQDVFERLQGWRGGQQFLQSRDIPIRATGQVVQEQFNDGARLSWDHQTGYGAVGPFEEADIADRQAVQACHPVHQRNDGNRGISILDNENLRMTLRHYPMPTAPEPIVAEKW